MKMILLALCLRLSACTNHKLTGYNVKTTVGQIQYEDGRSNLYTGASVDMHLDVK